MNNLYYLSGRLLFGLLRPFIRLLSRPRTRVLITDGQGHVLLMRSWFGRQRWDLPGGGIKRRETAQEAAIREIAEETGLELTGDDIRLIGEFSRKTSDLSHGVILFHAKVTKGHVEPQHPFRFEVLEVQWWPVSRLPGRINMFVVRALRKLEEIEP